MKTLNVTLNGSLYDSKSKIKNIFSWYYNISGSNDCYYQCDSQCDTEIDSQCDTQCDTQIDSQYDSQTSLVGVLSELWSRQPTDTVCKKQTCQFTDFFLGKVGIKQILLFQDLMILNVTHTKVHIE